MAVKCWQPDDSTTKCESACGAASQCDEIAPNTNTGCNVTTGDIYKCDSACSYVPLYDCVDSCSDTDGGYDYLTKGTVTDNNLCISGQTSCPAPISYTDVCCKDNSATCGGQTGEKLNEYICSGNNGGVVLYDCASRTDGHVKCISGKGKCGCLSDADCPSGRTCDTVTNTCRTTCASNSECKNGWCCDKVVGGTGNCVAEGTVYGNTQLCDPPEWVDETIKTQSNSFDLILNFLSSFFS